MTARAWVALWTVYILWGSTYLGIELAGETIPPLFAAGIRFTPRGWPDGGLAAGPRTGTAPFRLGRTRAGSTVLVRRAADRRERAAVRRRAQGPDRPCLAHLRVGAALDRPSAHRSPATGRRAPRSRGRPSVSRRRAPRPARRRRHGVRRDRARRRRRLDLGDRLVPVLEAADAGRCLHDGGASRGSQAGCCCFRSASRSPVDESLDPADWSTRSLLGLLYLVLFGSLFGYTAYVWLLGHVPIGTVATYAYVNPLVAILLGVVFLDELVTWQIAVGAAVIRPRSPS